MWDTFSDERMGLSFARVCTQSSLCPAYNSSERTTVENPVSNSSFIVASWFVCLWVLPSNGSGTFAYLAVIAY
jgi:hypothetical protein